MKTIIRETDSQKQMTNFDMAERGLMVVIEIATYNHEKYIAKAIESILAQQVDFSYKIIICEDCSTDATAQICQSYKDRFPDKIDLYLNKENKGVKINAGRMHQLSLASDAKYIAMLDGDDYWTDVNKLQRQVDFLENNPDYTVCWTNYKILDNEQLIEPGWSKELPKQDRYEIRLNNAFDHYCTLTVTCLYRKNCLTVDDLLRFEYFKDNTIFSLCLSKGKGVLLNFDGGVVRNHSGGTYSAASQFQKSYADYLNYNELYTKIPNCKIPHYLYQTKGALITLLCTYLNKDAKAQPPIPFGQLYLKLLKGASFERKLLLSLLFSKFYLKQKLNG